MRVDPNGIRLNVGQVSLAHDNLYILQDKIMGQFWTGSYFVPHP